MVNLGVSHFENVVYLMITRYVVYFILDLGNDVLVLESMIEKRKKENQFIHAGSGSCVYCTHDTIGRCIWMFVYV